MANIRSKDIQDLASWNEKELRKLRITINNRISSLKAGGKAKAMPESHPLKDFELEDCQSLLENVLKAERSLKKT